MFDRLLRGDEFTAVDVADGSAATRRIQEEQSFDRPRTILDAGSSASAQAALTDTGYVSSIQVSRRWRRQQVRTRTTARCPRP